MKSESLTTLNILSMVSAGNTDYLFGYYIWLLAHPELRNVTFDSEYDMSEMEIHAVNPYIGLDGDYNYLDYCDIFMSRGQQVAPHYLIWNLLMNNIETLEPIFNARYRLLIDDLRERYNEVMGADRHDNLTNDNTLISRYEFIDSLDIAVQPVPEDEYDNMSSYVKGSSRTVEEIASQLSPRRRVH